MPDRRPFFNPAFFLLFLLPLVSAGTLAPVHAANPRESVQHAFFPLDNGYSAWNKAQKLHVRITENGGAVLRDMISNSTLSMLLAEVGRSRPVALCEPEFHADGIRMEMERGAVTEWYVNHPGSGLEHGVTVHSRPGGTGLLRADWILGGSFQPESANGGESIVFSGRNGALDFSGITAWDAEGTALSVRMELVGERIMRYSVDDSGAMYPVTIDPVFTQRRKITADDGELDDYFGESIDIDGDYIVVGASGHQVGLDANAGRAYVFERGGDTWVQSQILVPTRVGENFFYGFSVAIDNGRIVVGAPAGSGNVADSGVAFVFRDVGGAWVEEDVLEAGDGAANDGFGCAVAIDGDQIVVGASDADIDAEVDVGAAYVFSRDGVNWTQQAKITAPDGEAEDYFGAAVALSGTHLAIGADEANALYGAAYVYSGSGAAWSFQNMFNATGAGRFGFSLSLDGDTLAVGAFADEVFGYAGAAFVYRNKAGAWSFEQKLTAPTHFFLASMGASISLSGDNLVVGALGELSGAEVMTGAAYMFHRDGSAWHYLDKIIPSDGEDGDLFGSSVALDGIDLVVGAEGVVDSTGAAYIFNNTAPVVVSVSPADGTSGVAGNSKVSAVFDQGMNSSSFSSSTFKITRSTDGHQIDGNYSFDYALNTITFEPAGDLFPSIRYNVALFSGITNAFGLHLTGNSTWSFTTSSGLDLEGANILSVFPEARAVNASVGTCAVVTFSEDMDPATITSTTFSLTGVNGSTAYDSVGKRAYFIPDSPLDFATTYTAVMTTGVKDVSGNPLPTEQSWVFTTEVESPDSDGDGVNDNQDGYPNDPTKATFASAVTDAVISIALDAEVGGRFSNLRSRCPYDPSFDKTNLPDNMDFPNGMVSFSVLGLSKGAEVRVTFSCGKAHPAGAAAYKAGATGYYAFTEHTTMVGTECIIELKDGGYGDEDLMENGRIVDPVGVADPYGSGAGSAGTAGSGCMMNPAAGFGVEWLVLILSPVVLIVRHRFRAECG